MTPKKQGVFLLAARSATETLSERGARSAPYLVARYELRDGHGRSRNRYFPLQSRSLLGS